MTMPIPGAVRPTLSVVLLARETTSYLFQQTLTSLRRQKDVDLELLAVDCNQAGDPWSITLQEDISRQSDVRLLTPRHGSTLGAICNQALGQCQGEYVAFIDSSDQWQSEKSLRQIALLTEHPDSPACCCSGYSSVQKNAGREHRLIFRTPDEDPRHFFTTDQFSLASQLVYRREALLAIEGFDPALNALLHPELLYRLSATGPILFLSEALFVSASPTVFRDSESLYQALTHLLYKHDDLFLRSKRLYQAMCFRLSRQAARCMLWLQMVFHWVVGFCKAPFYACRTVAVLLLLRMRTLLTRSWQNFQLSRHTRRLHRLLHSVRKGGNTAMPLPLPDPRAETAAIFTVDPLLHDHPLQFANAANMQHVVLPEHTTVIRYGMFAFCRDMQSIEIPESVERIEAHAFHGCEQLRSIVFHPGSQLVSIGAYAFAGCVSLPEITLSGMVNHVGEYAFAACSSLTQFRFTIRAQGTQTARPLFPASWSSVPRGIFAGCRSLEAIHFPDDAQLTAIGEEAFAGCSSLLFVCLTGHIQQIGAYAFAGCQSLATFTMPHVDEVRIIGRGAFRNCESLTFFRIPMELISVSRQCFEGCKGLKYIKIPKKVTYVESRAFADCPDLTQAILLSTATKYAPDAFGAQVQIDQGG